MHPAGIAMQIIQSREPQSLFSLIHPAEFFGFMSTGAHQAINCQIKFSFSLQKVLGFSDKQENLGVGEKSLPEFHVCIWYTHAKGSVMTASEASFTHCCFPIFPSWPFPGHTTHLYLTYIHRSSPSLMLISLFSPFAMIPHPSALPFPPSNLSSSVQWRRNLSMMTVWGGQLLSQ